MTATQFRAALDRLDLSQVQAARLFGVNDRTVRRWVLDERSIPVAVILLVRLMLNDRISVRDIENCH